MWNRREPWKGPLTPTSTSTTGGTMTSMPDNTPAKEPTIEWEPLEATVSPDKEVVDERNQANDKDDRNLSRGIEL